VIPLEWVGDERRAFHVVAADGARRAGFPPTLLACVSVAADAEGILAAEAIARDLARLAGKHRERILWRVVAPGVAPVIGWEAIDASPAPAGWDTRVADLGRLGVQFEMITPCEIVLRVAAVDDGA
jgi:hypothetical protein